MVSSTFTPNLRCIFSAATASWVSPMPERMVSPVSRSRCTCSVGSSSARRVRAEPILSMSALVLGCTASLKMGLGKTMGVSLTGLSWAQRVSPVAVTLSLATAPMSPAPTWVTGSWVLPPQHEELPDAFGRVLVEFQTCELLSIAPAKNAEIGQLAHIGVGGGLENQRRQRPSLTVFVLSRAPAD